MDNYMQELLMRQNEQLSLLERQDTHIRFCYTTVIAVIAAAFAVSANIILNIALLIIIPISLRIVRLRKAAAHISGYITAYLEDKTNVKWESHNNRFKKAYPGNFSDRLFYYASKSDLLVISAAIIALFWYRQGPIDILSKILLILFHSAVIVIEAAITRYFSSFYKQSDEETKKWKSVLSKND